ncbi:Alanine racemase 1 [Candidatus Methanoperedenaceae archaeon GB37]|nr:Alanine racemase 1 [Candidatus Methanoperedenaceae archaeon GB37]
MQAGWLEINLKAIGNNLKEIKKIIGKNVKTMPVVKANAYGHGLVPVARKLEEVGADFLAVSYIEEGIKLRKAGIKMPIVILLGVSEAEIDPVFTYGLTPIIYEYKIASMLSEIAQKNNTNIAVFIKIDTGMGRLGVFYKEAPLFLKKVSALPGLKIQGLTSHLAVAETDKTFTEKQINRFKTVLDEAQKAGINLPYNHIANSMASLQYKESLFQIVRPGLSIYGIYPIPLLKKKINLQPAMSFKTRILYLKSIPPKIGVSYGHTFVTTQKTKVAVLPVGYDQGLFRQLSNKGEVIIKGKKAPIIGTICMHLTMIDVTHIDGIEIGEEGSNFRKTRKRANYG